MESRPHKWRQMTHVGLEASIGAAVLCGSLFQSSTFANAQMLAFQCPEGGYTQSCKSYQELVQAKDEDVAANLVCFREVTDEFFVINVGYVSESTYTWYHLDHGFYRLQPGAKQSGSVSIYTFKNGIQDSSQNPYLIASGNWFAFTSNFIFTGHEWNVRTTGKTSSKPESQLDISSDQIVLSKHYISRTNKVVDYSLTIQRSTKRFSESFDVAHDSKLNIENTGRCVEVKHLPTLPEPPPTPPASPEN